MGKEREKRICFMVTSFARRKGDQSLNLDFASRLAKKGWEVDVVVPHDNFDSKGFEIMQGVKTHRFQYFWPMSMQNVAYKGGMAENLGSVSGKLQFPLFMTSFALKTASVSKNNDIIFAQWVPSLLIALALKPFHKKPILFWCHRMLVKNPLMKRIAGFCLSRADCCLFNSTYTMQLAKNIAKMKHTELLKPSVDMQRFSPKRSDFIRKKYKVDKKTPVILNIGRLVEKKGQAFLIDALGILKKQNRKFFCVIIGRGPEKDGLQSRIEELGLQKQVKLAGFVHNHKIPAYLNSSDLFVVPSIVDSKNEVETLGIVGIEALACGTPVVGSKVGGIPDVVIDNVNGLLVKQRDAKALADKIERLLLNKKLLKKFSGNARKSVVQKFDWNNTIKGFEETCSSYLPKPL